MRALGDTGVGLRGSLSGAGIASLASPIRVPVTPTPALQPDTRDLIMALANSVAEQQRMLDAARAREEALMATVRELQATAHRHEARIEALAHTTRQQQSDAVAIISAHAEARGGLEGAVHRLSSDVQDLKAAVQSPKASEAPSSMPRRRFGGAVMSPARDSYGGGGGGSDYEDAGGGGDGTASGPKLVTRMAMEASLAALRSTVDSQLRALGAEYSRALAAAQERQDAYVSEQCSRTAATLTKRMDTVMDSVTSAVSRLATAVSEQQSALDGVKHLVHTADANAAASSLEHARRVEAVELGQQSLQMTLLRRQKALGDALMRGLHQEAHAREDAVEACLAQVRTGIAEASGRWADFASTVDKLRAEVADHTTRALTRTTAAVDERLAALRLQVTEATSAMCADSLKHGREELQSAIQAQMQTAILKLGQQAPSSAEAAAAAAAAAAATTAVAKLTEDLRSCTTSVAALQGRADTLQGRADTLQGRADTLQRRVDTLDTSCAAAHAAATAASTAAASAASAAAAAAATTPKPAAPIEEAPAHAAPAAAKAAHASSVQPSSPDAPHAGAAAADASEPSSTGSAEVDLQPQIDAHGKYISILRTEVTEMAHTIETHTTMLQKLSDMVVAASSRAAAPSATAPADASSRGASKPAAAASAGAAAAPEALIEVVESKLQVMNAKVASSSKQIDEHCEMCVSHNRFLVRQLGSELEATAEAINSLADFHEIERCVRFMVDVTADTVLNHDVSTTTDLLIQSVAQNLEMSHGSRRSGGPHVALAPAWQGDVFPMGGWKPGDLM